MQRLFCHAILMILAAQSVYAFTLPKMLVTGTLLSSSGNLAILKGANQTYLVRVGDRLGDYTIVGIDRLQVVARHGRYRFRFGQQ